MSAISAINRNIYKNLKYMEGEKMEKNKNKVIKKAFLITAAAMFSLLLALSLSSCITIKLNNKDIRGSGELITQDFQVSDFDRLDFNGIGNIIITQGETESLQVEAERNVIERLEISSGGKMLKIGYKNNFFNIIPTKTINFYLSVKDLREISISGVGSIKCDKLTTDDLSIDSSGAGSVDMNLITTVFEMALSGAGKVNITGQTQSQSIDISGAGSYNAKEFTSKDCEISISGLGRATVNASDTLDVNMSGLGSVEYIGKPAISQEISGGGSVKSIN
jgi:hypothetical protein